MTKIISKEKITKFIFTKENQQKINKILKKYPTGREKSAILPLLDLAQRQNEGYLSPAAIEAVSNIIKQPYIKTYEVASFYTMFNLKPVGKYHLQLCGTTPCMIKNSEKILQKIKKLTNISVGETSKDGLFSLSEVECLGACVNAPVVQINDNYFEDLTEDKIEEIINKIKSEKTINKATNKAQTNK